MDLREDQVDLWVFQSCLGVDREGLSFERSDLLLDPKVQSLELEDLWFERRVQRVEPKDRLEEQKVHSVFLQVHSVFLQDLLVFLQDLWVFLRAQWVFHQVQRLEMMAHLVCRQVHSCDSPPQLEVSKDLSLHREARWVLLRAGSTWTAVREDRSRFDLSRRGSRGVLSRKHRPRAPRVTQVPPTEDNSEFHHRADGRDSENRRYPPCSVRSVAGAAWNQERNDSRDRAGPRDGK